ncbi:MAG: SIS domain-containing protein [Acidobacteria bacterium]|nr:SIS domain-containing protein [Acidobacteriota bacterium]
MEYLLSAVAVDLECLLRDAVDRFGDTVEETAREAARRVRKGGRVYLLGNGGSAADALHWAGELMGRFRLDRPGIPAFALAGNPALLTATANDMGYDRVFARQLLTLAGPNDVVVAISTSGNSPNVVAALEAVAGVPCLKVGFTGRGGGDVGPLCDVLFDVDSTDTPRIQEIHEVLGHVFCERLEALLQEVTR